MSPTLQRFPAQPLKNCLLKIGTLLAFSIATLPTASKAAEPKPVLLKPEGQQFTLLKNWTFGNQRPDATVHNKAELDQDFHYRYIWENGKLDKFKTSWCYHRDYPEGDPKSVHVFSDKALTLKGRIPPGGGLKDRGIESGLLRAKIPITPGMYIEMSARLSGGVGAWPNFWLEAGVQYPDGKFSPTPKPLPEIDIFEFFNWDGRPQTRILTGNIQVFGHPSAYGYPYDLYTTFKDAGYEKHLDLGFDCSKEFHVFALDWVENKPIWLLDGKPIKQTYYEWHGAPAHIVVANTIGMNLPGVKQTEMVADEKQWDYVIDYIRVWEHKPGAISLTDGLPLNPRPERPASLEINSFARTGGKLTVEATGKWQSPMISDAKADAAKLRQNPLLKVDISVPAEAANAGWFQVKLAIQGENLARTESPKWLLEKAPGTTGIEKATITWDTSEIKIPKNPTWFKIELVTQGDHARTISVSNLRAEAPGGAPAGTAPKAAEPKAEAKAPAPAAAGTLATPYPDKDQDWPGKGVIRKFPFMVGERNAIRARRDKEQGFIVFVGDSLTGGWKNLAKDLPKFKVANCGVGGDVSRGVLFRFKEDVLDRNPKAIVIEIGNNDLTAAGKPADMLSNVAAMLAMADKDKPGTPIVLCSIPPSANPAAPVKANDRQAMNDGIRKLVSERPNTFFCDVSAATAEADGSPKPEYFAADKLHLNDAGHTRWAEVIIPIFEKLKLQ